MSLGAVVTIEEPPLYILSKPIEYIVTEGGCWECISHPRSGYYLSISRNGKRDKVHRYVYELLVRPIALGISVLHRCDNTSCINPEHLWLGTQRDNVVDMYSKGRGVNNRGSKHGQAKLTEGQVSNIRSLYSRGISQVVLSSLFNITRATIWKIVHNRIWRSI